MSSLLFGRLAVTTAEYIAAENPPAGRFTARGGVYLPELEESYAEYVRVEGFEAQKRAFRAYLDREAARQAANPLAPE
jgi:hypothetical protein